jgi:hypothetical protein
MYIITRWSDTQEYISYRIPKVCNIPLSIFLVPWQLEGPPLDSYLMEDGEIYHVIHIIPCVSSTGSCSWSYSSLVYSLSNSNIVECIDLFQLFKETPRNLEELHSHLKANRTLPCKRTHRLRWLSDCQIIDIFQCSALWTLNVTIYIDSERIMSCKAGYEFGREMRTDRSS